MKRIPLSAIFAVVVVSSLLTGCREKEEKVVTPANVTAPSASPAAPGATQQSAASAQLPTFEKNPNGYPEK